MAQERPAVFSHAAICTADLERSTRFYTQAFGFEQDMHVEFSEPFEKITELPEVSARATFFWLGDFRLELLEYTTPGSVGSPERRPINKIGLSHLGIAVRDIDEAVSKINEFGGQALDHTRIWTPAGHMIFCTDPDGTRLEIWQKPEET